MRFIARIHDGPTVHRIDRAEHREEVRTLRQLVNAWLTRLILPLDSKLPRARKDLTRDEEWYHISDEPVPGHLPAHQVVVVTAVAVADEISVVLIEPSLF